MKSSLKFAATAAVFAAVSVTSAHAAQRGVSDSEVVFGIHTAMSGPVAVWGVPSVNGIKMRFDDVNAEGGVFGRQLKLVVEDNEYQVPKAVQAANKLINRDRVFAMLGALGTPMNNAVLPRQLAAGVPNLFPLTSARQMYEPFHKLKFVALSSYYDQMRAGYKYFSEQHGKTKPCIMYQDTDYGREIEMGILDQSKAMGQSVLAETAHKPTDKDFTAAITKLREAGCDMIYMGTIVSDTIIPYATARSMGWDVEFLGSVSTYSSYTAGAKGGVTEGFMAMTSFQMAYEDETDPQIHAWYVDYVKRFGKNPDQAAQLGWIYADITVQALQNSGKDLTTDSFVAGMEAVKGYKDIFGGPPVSFGPDKHKGSDNGFISVVKNGRWTRVTGSIGY